VDHPTGEKPRRSRRVPRSFWKRALYSFALIVAVLIIGTVAMHAIEGWSVLDSFYFTSFIATGQGPPPNISPDSDLGKVVASLLAFVSVGTVITALLFLFGPFLGTVLREGEERMEEFEKQIEGKGSKTDPEAEG
jgi:ABC-type phosphate transport system permease subunit